MARQPTPPGPRRASRSGRSTRSRGSRCAGTGCGCRSSEFPPIAYHLGVIVLGVAQGRALPLLPGAERAEFVDPGGAVARGSAKLRPGAQMAHRSHHAPQALDLAVRMLEREPVLRGLQLAQDEAAIAADRR